MHQHFTLHTSGARLFQDKSLDFVRRWIRQHAEDAAAAGKPLLLEEFGKWSGGSDAALVEGSVMSQRDEFMWVIYEEVAVVSLGYCCGYFSGWLLMWRLACLQCSCAVRCSVMLFDAPCCTVNCHSSHPTMCSPHSAERAAGRPLEGCGFLAVV